MPSAPMIFLGDLKEPSAATTCNATRSVTGTRHVWPAPHLVPPQSDCSFVVLFLPLAQHLHAMSHTKNLYETNSHNAAITKQTRLRHLADAAAPPHVLLLLLRPPRIVGSARYRPLLCNGVTRLPRRGVDDAG